jgi:hypothetical protein
VAACRTGLCGRGGGRNPVIAAFSAPPPGRLGLRVAVRGEDGPPWSARGLLKRGALDLPLTAAAPVFRAGGRVFSMLVVAASTCSASLNLSCVFRLNWTDWFDGATRPNG